MFTGSLMNWGSFYLSVCSAPISVKTIVNHLISSQSDLREPHLHVTTEPSLCVAVSSSYHQIRGYRLSAIRNPRIFPSDPKPTQNLKNPLHLCETQPVSSRLKPDPNFHVGFFLKLDPKFPELWNFLSTRFKSVRLAHYYQLHHSLVNHNQEAGQSVNEYCHKPGHILDNCPIKPPRSRSYSTRAKNFTKPSNSSVAAAAPDNSTTLYLLNQLISSSSSGLVVSPAKSVGMILEVGNMDDCTKKIINVKNIYIS
uniref:Uncharacterized protein n=1 Tax=Cucumis melo TaxID=3656 RepID=A0A9I9EBD8_CUCME